MERFLIEVEGDNAFEIIELIRRVDELSDDLAEVSMLVKDLIKRLDQKSKS